MNVEARARAYVAALDAHDGAACAALFTPGGSFEDPETGGPIAGDAIAELVQRGSAVLSPRYTIRALAVAAWDSEEALANGIARHHAAAKHAFHTADISPGVWTSVWKPVRTNRIWTRCPSCTTPNDVNDDHRACTRCGATLPERPTFW